jgi:parallel beta-helix repeat protein
MRSVLQENIFVLQAELKGTFAYTTEQGKNIKNGKLIQMKLKSLPTLTLTVLLVLATFASALFSFNELSNPAAVGSGFLPVSYAAGNSSNENFTIVVLPDTQGYVKYYPWLFDSQTQWIVDNKEALNIVFVTQLGDLVDEPDNLTQWENANKSMSKLDDSVPWGVLPGNHDMFEGNLTNYDMYFGYARFSGKNWYGGTYAAGDNANSYELFSAGGDDYLIFHIQYNPSDDVLYWASNIIEAYPDRKVIVSTHDYLMGFAKTGQRSDVGERMWHSLVKPHADQIFLVLCGHAGAEDLITDKVNGHVVYQMLADYQNKTIIESGWLRILQFCPIQEKIFVKTYSPLLDKYKNDSESEFTLDYKTVNVPPARPEGTTNENNTIYIRPNGSIEPSTAPIQCNGDTYTFKENILGSIIVERSNVVIDGAGFTLRGTGAEDYRPSVEPIDQTRLSDPNYLPSREPAPDPYITPDSNNTGIYSYAQCLTVRNLKITECWCAIELEYSSDNCIFENEITGNTHGVWIHSSSNDTISGNTVSSNKQGVSLTTAHDNVHGNSIINNLEYGIKLSWSFNSLSGNDIENNRFGVSLEYSSHNVFKNNSFSKNTRIFYNPGWSFPEQIQDVDSSNLADGKPIYYWVNKQDMTVPADAGWGALINCTRMKIENLNLAQGQEILLIETTHSTVTRNVMAHNDVCIYLDESSNNTISENTLIDSYCGIQLEHSSDNDIEHNNVTSNTQGIFLDSSSKNIIHGNDVTRNNRGIELSVSTSNLISGNNLAANVQGITLFGTVFYDYSNGDSNNVTTVVYASLNNTVFKNSIIDNTCGVWIRLSSSNTFSSNNFLNNTDQVKVESSFAEYASANSWDDGEKGNYWSDYQSRYPNATALDGSGTWNTSYVINENNRDNHPLIEPVKISDDATFLILLLVFVAVPTAAAVALGIGVYRQRRKFKER